MKPFISSTKAYGGTVVSAIAVPFLLVLGALFQNNAPTLVQGHRAPKDPKAVATGCYGAAGIYAVLFVICLCQVFVYRRQPPSDFPRM
ncbi:hypothetical protein BKA69DRAFT_1059658 [Paraphysoderma sedebokerense]|nr:hypothetical protein BKA69DRAFT_1059658 [Paraphysoderma sedebokerense]